VSYVLLAVVIWAAIAVMTAISIVWGRRRDRALAAAAEALGFTFSTEASDTDEILDSLQALPLIRDTRRGAVSRVMRGRHKGRDVVLFDYEHTLRGGSDAHRQTPRQTVALLSSEGLDLPGFAIRPAHAMEKLIGYEGVNFVSHEAFSDRYRVETDDEDACRALLTELILDYFAARHNLAADGLGDHLLFFRPKATVSPRTIEPFLDEALEVLRLFDPGT